MRIDAKVQILKAEERTFPDKKTGQAVPYNIATIMLDGTDLIDITVDKSLISSLVGLQNKEGKGTLEITSGFKNKAKLTLVAFK